MQSPPKKTETAMMTADSLLCVFLILLSAAVGSFIGVVADRLGRGEDMIGQPSCCRSCGRRLGVGQLIPLLSFLWARGRCRHCGAEIPPWLLYSEILAIGAAVLALSAAGGGGDNWPDVLFSCAFLWLLLALALCDWRWMRLPDAMTGALLGLVLVWSWSRGAALEQLVWEVGLGALLGAGSFGLLRRGYRALRDREGLGLGDVKLMLGLGGFAGPLDLPLLVLMAALLAIVGAGVATLAQGRRINGTTALPFGCALCAAAALLWWMRAMGWGVS